MPRAFAEYFFALLALATGPAILFWAGGNLGVYILWSAAIDLAMLKLAWCVSFVALGLIQVGMLLLCTRRCSGYEGVCKKCPLFPTCAINSGRRWTALLSALTWVFLSFSLGIGGVMLAVPAAVACAAALFTVFSLLPQRPRSKPHHPAWTSS